MKYDGFDELMRKKDSFASRQEEYRSAMVDNILQEASPYLNRTAISKGTVQTISGGLTELLSTEGGTVLFTVDPDTGVVTIGGPIQAGVTLNVGTINNTVIAGTSALSGTLTNNRLIQNGTYSRGTFAGTPAFISPLDLSPIAAGSRNLIVTPTSDSPTVTWTGAGTFIPNGTPEGYIEISVNGSARYLPFFI